MKIFKIVRQNGNVVGYVRAQNERHALCVYLTSHEELNDMMLWKCVSGTWKLSEYDNEDNYMYAKEECHL